MALLIGMDEAGLGPNLGPFVVASTVWEVPDRPDQFDFWTAFDTILTNSPSPQDPRLHIADSKEVFQPQRGLQRLEQGVWAALKLAGIQATCYHSLCQELVHTPASPMPTLLKSAKNCSDTNRSKPQAKSSLFHEDEVRAARSPSETACLAEDHRPLPWYEGPLYSLPAADPDHDLIDRWQTLCLRLGVRLIAVRADIVEPLRFNRLVHRYDNKAQATSRLAMNLLRQVWNPDHDALIVADKHGGRNRYDTLLSETFGLPVDCQFEGSDQSRYRLGNGELLFQPRAETQGPVALASMVAKYLREVSMHQFNRFWQKCIPGLKPTQGYPTDARRFKEAIQSEQQRRNIPDNILWRQR